jgi:hypothetical protein
MNSPIKPSYYYVGGAVPIQASSYVNRKADIELYQGLKAGEFCYIFNARQMGKSSLRIHTIEKLEAEGFTCIDIDMSLLVNKNITAEQWYAGILSRFAKHPDLKGKFNLRPWLKENDYLDPASRLSIFIEDVLLEHLTSHTVIFIDEIDSTLSLDFSVNDFFEIMRSCYNQCRDRSSTPCLTFVLLGVTTPYDLLKDKKGKSDTTSTPFNIGKSIKLTGFTLAEAQPLAGGLTETCQNPDLVLEEILNWTAGKPFLTQKICKIIVDSGQFIAANSEAAQVENLVQTKIINKWESQDVPEHLKTIRDRLIFPDHHINLRLGTYHKILQDTVLADQSLEQRELRLAGVVIEEQGQMKIANRIYETIFDLNWVEKELAKIRPYADAFNGWQKSKQQDSSFLLKGEQLKQALKWAENQLLDENDFQFLIESQKIVLNKYEKEKELLLKIIKEKREQIKQRDQEIEDMSHKIQET